MKTRKLRIKRKLVVKSRKKGKLNRKISIRRKQRKSMMRCRKRNSRNNFKKRFSRKMSGGGQPISFEFTYPFIKSTKDYLTSFTFSYTINEKEVMNLKIHWKDSRTHPNGFFIYPENVPQNVDITGPSSIRITNFTHMNLNKQQIIDLVEPDIILNQNEVSIRGLDNLNNKKKVKIVSLDSNDDAKNFKQIIIDLVKAANEARAALVAGKTPKKAMAAGARVAAKRAQERAKEKFGYMSPTLGEMRVAEAWEAAAMAAREGVGPAEEGVAEADGPAAEAVAEALTAADEQITEQEATRLQAE